MKRFEFIRSVVITTLAAASVPYFPELPQVDDWKWKRGGRFKCSSDEITDDKSYIRDEINRQIRENGIGKGWKLRSIQMGFEGEDFALNQMTVIFEVIRT